MSCAFLPNLIVCFSCSDEDVVLSKDGFFKVKREKKLDGIYFCVAEEEERGALCLRGDLL